MEHFQETVGFIWSIAKLLRGDFKQSEYGRIVLPLTVLRRLDCVLHPTKDKVLAKAKSLPKKADEKMQNVMLCQASGEYSSGAGGGRASVLCCCALLS